MKAVAATVALLCLVISSVSCSYNELTPKTDDRSESYQLPKGEIPSADDQLAVKAIRNEYNSAIK